MRTTLRLGPVEARPDDVSEIEAKAAKAVAEKAKAAADEADLMCRQDQCMWIAGIRGEQEGSPVYLYSMNMRMVRDSEKCEMRNTRWHGA